MWSDDIAKYDYLGFDVHANLIKRGNNEHTLIAVIKMHFLKDLLKFFLCFLCVAYDSIPKIK